MVQKLKPYAQYLGDSWVEKNITIPFWKKQFKKLGIFNKDYHEKYRQDIKNKRYKKYIELVINDIQDDIQEKLEKK